jgi:capsular exopolysaccharide synthesis family protein
LSPERQDGTDAVKATILTPAVVPTEPSSPKVVRNLALGLALGLLLGIGIVLLRKTMDNKIRNDADVHAVTDLAVLGTIAFNAEMDRNHVLADNDPSGYEAEAIRRLRTNLQFVRPADRSFSLVVTSSVPGEGKSTTSINLAVALADAGSRTLLIDADLRRPSVAEYLGLEGIAGLTTVLIGRASADDVIQNWRGGLDVMPAGQIPPNPSELLGSDSMAGLLKDLISQYDVVILDSSPLLPVTDAAVLSSVVDGVLVVIGAATHRPQFREALDSLHAAGGHAFGVVLNKVVRKRSSRYAYSYGYGSYKPLETSGAPDAPVAETRRLETAK